MENKIDVKTLAVACIALTLVVIFLMFGFVAVKTLVAMIVVFFLPYYFILKNWFENDEAVFLSFFFGFGITPLLVYYLNMIIPSLRITILVTAILVYLVAILLQFKASKK